MEPFFKNLYTRVCFCRNYIKHGSPENFYALLHYHEGLENLSLWLKKNKWIDTHVSGDVTALLNGEKMLEDPPEKLKVLKESVLKYLDSGDVDDFQTVKSDVLQLAQDSWASFGKRLRKAWRAIDIPERALKIKLPK